jgi:methionyl aminopeptidase
VDLLKRIDLKSPQEIQKMRTSGILLRSVMDEVEKNVAPGVTTAELDKIARKLILAGGAIPAFLGYHGFPATLCTSVNEEIVHGIPSLRKLMPGDIISVDCGLVLNGFYADTAFTRAVGEVSAEARLLLETTSESLYAGIREMKPGVRIGTVCSAIQNHNEAQGFSIVRDYTGHGTSPEFRTARHRFSPETGNGPGH